jgi:hypothetical protein
MIVNKDMALKAIELCFAEPVPELPEGVCAAQWREGVLKEVFLGLFVIESIYLDNIKATEKLGERIDALAQKALG